ncbi:hypothetical protein LEP1GSC125_3919 [Leptospira mayottensis 200901122]|uniref:Uncharacterized protein n=1 Tax=Leptospira mayottensis 200901122 TaxID=1193010 RepID=A0AA87MTI9_9LEPT|nr:hypothetical protein LEP1GSC125_3919 [Leptospira mayottensis 200901122]
MRGIQNSIFRILKRKNRSCRVEECHSVLIDRPMAQSVTSCHRVGAKWENLQVSIYQKIILFASNIRP